MPDTYSSPDRDEVSFKPVVILFHPNVDYGIVKQQVCSVILDGSVNSIESAHNVHQLIEEKSGITPLQRDKLLLDHVSEAFIASRHFFEKWIPKKPQGGPGSLVQTISLNAADIETCNVLYGSLRAPEKDERQIARGFDESTVPWIKVGDKYHLLGASPKDIFTRFDERQISPNNFVGLTSTELRLAFATAPLKAALSRYEEIDLRKQQEWFFDGILKRPDLVI